MFGEIFGSVLGGLLGGGGSENSQPQNQIDPRLAKYVYGENGKGGLLDNVMSQYQQQYAQGGLNDLQRAGLESQRQVYASPQYTPYTPTQTPSLQAMNTPIQSVAQYQATNAPAPAPSQNDLDAAIDEYMKANGLGKYAGNVNTNYENFA